MLVEDFPAELPPVRFPLPVTPRRNPHFSLELAAKRRLIAIAAIKRDFDETAIRRAQDMRRRFDPKTGEQLTRRHVEDGTHNTNYDNSLVEVKRRG